MPSRIIREGILSSERINLLSESAELFYRRVMSIVDDYGRFFANPSLLRANCYPLKLDSVKETQILAHLAECLDARLIIVYEIDSKSYLQLSDFKQQLRAKDSKYPPPNSQMLSGCDATAKHPCTDVHLDGGGVVVEYVIEGGVGGGGGGDSAKKRKPDKTPLPDDFSISQAVRSWASEKGHAQLEARLEDFIGRAKANGYAYVDWDQAFMNSIRNDWAKLSPNNGNGAKNNGYVSARDASRTAAYEGLTGRKSRPANAGSGATIYENDGNVRIEISGHVAGH